MADTQSIRVRGAEFPEMAAFDVGQVESCAIYESFRLKFTITGSLEKDETISTYNKNTLREFDFEREWTWTRVELRPTTGDAIEEIFGIAQSGAIQFASSESDLSSGECYITPTSTSISAGDDGIGGLGGFTPDLSKPGDQAMLAATSNSSEAVGTETITYSGTGAPSNPSPTDINANPTPSSPTPTYGGDISDAYWQVGSAISVGGVSAAASDFRDDITSWTITDWLDKRGIFTTPYSVPTPVGWDSCDVVITWEWEFA